MSAFFKAHGARFAAQPSTADADSIDAFDAKIEADETEQAFGVEGGPELSAKPVAAVSSFLLKQCRRQ